MASTVRPQIHLGVGTPADFAALAEFHYRSHHPGAVTRIYTARFEPESGLRNAALHPTAAAVLVMSLPALGCTLRTIATSGRYQVPNRALAAALLNKEVRTISRVIVHPLFRALGLARELVEYALAQAETPYVEALAAMGRVHPFFEQAGMRKFDRPPDARTARLVAALEHLGLTPLDLCSHELWQTRLDAATGADRGFFLRELHTFAGGRFSALHAARERSDIILRLVTHARNHLLSQPIYYLWRKEM